MLLATSADVDQNPQDAASNQGSHGCKYFSHVSLGVSKSHSLTYQSPGIGI